MAGRFPLHTQVTETEENVVRGEGGDAAVQTERKSVQKKRSRLFINCYLKDTWGLFVWTKRFILYVDAKKRFKN
jgi:hypothetical protein